MVQQGIVVCCLASEPEVILVLSPAPNFVDTHSEGGAAPHQTPRATTGLKLHCFGTNPTVRTASTHSHPELSAMDRQVFKPPHHPQSHGEIPIPIPLPIPALQLNTIIPAPRNSPVTGRAQREQRSRPSRAPRGAGGSQGWQAGLGELRGGVSRVETPLHVQWL